jgi:hypothetical protein
MANPVPDRGRNSKRNVNTDRYVVQADGQPGHPLTGYTVVDTKTGQTVDHRKLVGGTLPFLGLGGALDLKNALNAKEKR